MRKYDAYKSTKIKKEDGSTTYQQQEVHKLLINNLKETQTLASEPKYEEPLPFPQMSELEANELEAILSRLSHGKAIAFYGLSELCSQDCFERRQV